MVKDMFETDVFDYRFCVWRGRYVCKSCGEGKKNCGCSPCHKCNGTGNVENVKEVDFGNVLCQECNGSGSDWKEGLADDPS